MIFNYSMTIPQWMEFQRLKENSIKFSEFDLYIAIVGSCLCLGKTISNRLGFNSLYLAFYTTTKIFFWFLIFISLIKGIKNTCNKKTRNAGIGQLIGVTISSILMIV